MRGLLVLCLLVGAPGKSGAQPGVGDPDTQAAQRHFEHGRELYEAGRYDEALVEFQTARVLKALPELDYNIARTDERREAWGEAADAYERYLGAKPDAPDASELRGRIQVLRGRVKQPQSETPPRTETQPPASPPSRPLRSGGIGAMVATLVLAGVGGALVGTVGPDYQRLESTCSSRQCISADWRGLEARADAGYALLGLAGAAAVAGIALFVADAKHRPAQAWIAPAGPGIAVGGAF
jgi:tetratricopeptide (TPR) repeat protein